MLGKKDFIPKTIEDPFAEFGPGHAVYSLYIHMYPVRLPAPGSLLVVMSMYVYRGTRIQSRQPRCHVLCDRRFRLIVEILVCL